MSKSIMKVRGIGPSSVTILADNGIVTAEDLAAKTISQVATIKGFSEIRAAQVIADAKTLVSPEKSKKIKKNKPAKKAVEKKKTAKKSNKKKLKEKVDKKAKKAAKNKKASKGKKGKKAAKKTKK